MPGKARVSRAGQGMISPHTRKRHAAAPPDSQLGLHTHQATTWAPLFWFMTKQLTIVPHCRVLQVIPLKHDFGGVGLHSHQAQQGCGQPNACRARQEGPGAGTEAVGGTGEGVTQHAMADI